MKARIKILASPILGLGILSTLILMPGCGPNPTVINRDLASVSLAEIWETIANATRIQEESANLDSVSMRCDKDGWVMSLYLTFHAEDQNGRHKAFQTSINGRGELNWSSFEDSSVPVTHDPGMIFSEIDEIGLSALERGDAGLALEIHFQWGDVGYRQSYSDIFHLQNGVLRALEEIVFHSTKLWGEISTFKLYPSPLGGGASSTMPGYLPQERTSQIWFLNGDVELASVVKYLEN